MSFKALILVILFVTFTQQAEANLALSKFRLYFDQNNRTDSLQLRNPSSTAINYKLTLGLMAMTEEGTLHKVEEDPQSAIALLRYSPKRGTIEAGGNQALRFALRKPAGLADGEYRAHLTISSTAKTADSVNVNLNPTLSYSIPIIVRHGRVEATTELLEPNLVMRSGIPHIEFWQTRQGNRSIFGNFIISDEQGNELGLLNNSAVYQPLEKRKVTIGLNDMVKGKVLIEFKEIAAFGGELSATTEIELK